MELVLLLPQSEVHPPPDAPGTPGAPLFQQLPDAKDLGGPGDQDVEVAGDGVLEGRRSIEPGHELVRVHAPLEVDGQLQTVQVGLVPHIVDLFQLAGLNQLRHLVQNGLHGGGVGDFVNLHQILALDVAVLAPDFDGAPAGAVDLLKGGLIVNHLAAGGEVGAHQDGGEIARRVFQVGDRGVADLRQIEAAQLGRHAHGDALVGGDQKVGVGGGQQGGLLHGVVVVVHEIHRVLIQVTEQLLTDGGELGLGVPAGGVGHVPGVDLAEVALGVHKGVEQGTVAFGEADHGVVDGAVPVGVEAHGLAHDIGGLGPGPGEEAHLIHGIQQLPVGGLEAVDLRDGPGEDHRHGVGHEIGLHGVGDELLQHLGPEAHDVGIIYFWLVFIGGLLLRHSAFPY